MTEPQQPSHRTYSVALDRYAGPMDLLLYLIRSQELDIEDIPVATICDQYLEFMETLQELDLGVAGEFLVVASTLVELKSRALLPPIELEGEEEDEVEDPRSDLVRKLLEYKQFRDLSLRLADLRQDFAARYPRGAPAWESAGDEARELTIEATLWDLLAAYQKVIREVALKTPRTIVYDDTPITQHMERVLDRVRREGAVDFFALFEGRKDRGFIIGTFLALLELCKQLFVKAVETEDGESIMVEYREPTESGAQGGETA